MVDGGGKRIRKRDFVICCCRNWGGNYWLRGYEMKPWLQIYTTHIKRCRALGLKPMSLIRLYEIVWKFGPIEIPVFLEEK